jgi:hypothetical protein
VVDRAGQPVDLGDLGDQAGRELQAVDVLEHDGAVDVVAGEQVGQQLLDHAAGAGLEVAVVVGALREHDAVHDAVRCLLRTREQQVLQVREVDLDGRADVGGRLVARVRRLEHQLLGVQLQLDRRVGQHAGAAGDAKVVVQHPTQVHRPRRRHSFCYLSLRPLSCASIRGAARRIDPRAKGLA